ncbi:hypothetical protein SAMN05444392_11924 [Seinonella peptonophila]|uniref:Uncharacterized protein n=1 Tax=Seinonella peptonophila TaxID=112248 RepID=A0A1M5B7W6_9BACL|nr:hypothetical protein [Seinonella peptonophila]SHF38538.1 hypothetical protein SAMN05444392_11924 [Seinonella peptonophila]
MSIFDNDVSRLIQKTVYLQILRSTLEWDRLRMRETKMYKVYNSLIDHVINEISHDLYELKKQLMINKAKIVFEDQLDKARHVEYQHRGYVFKVEYLNHHIKLACENLLQDYLGL